MRPVGLYALNIKNDASKTPQLKIGNPRSASGWPRDLISLLRAADELKGRLLTAVYRTTLGLAF